MRTAGACLSSPTSPRGWRGWQPFYPRQLGFAGLPMPRGPQDRRTLAQVRSFEFLRSGPWPVLVWWTLRSTFHFMTNSSHLGRCLQLLDPACEDHTGSCWLWQLYSLTLSGLDISLLWAPRTASPPQPKRCHQEGAGAHKLSREHPAEAGAGGVTVCVGAEGTVFVSPAGPQWMEGADVVRAELSRPRRCLPFVGCSVLWNLLTVCSHDLLFVGEGW
ncbi:uncharacterized protein [Equus caballus]|uniref:uncharacterized protein isoform X3 n=1 Tax=Equus caballus TaxID=9796 RepID=UPI0038B3192D